MVDKKTLPGVWIFISNESKFTKVEQTKIIELIAKHIEHIRNVLENDQNVFLPFKLRGFQYDYMSDISLYNDTVMILVKRKIERE